ncbi:MAG: S8 family peptidase [Lewinellaceae bacterium]|nr:S8 family peptidase [Saprospiraceae bacterium]MCB9345528.1 S8 family peptidase [Lewinellaceae bacterium]
MQKFKLAIIFLSLVSISLQGQNNEWRNKVSPEVLAAINDGKPCDIIIAFKQQADLSDLNTIHGKTAKASAVFNRLQEISRKSQARTIDIIQTYGASANSLFLINGLSLEKAAPELIQKLALLPEVNHISFDPWVYFPGAFEDIPVSVTDRNTVEWGVARVHAPEVWAMGYAGQGITVGGADTGYDWEHPAIKGHYRGWDAGSQTADHNYNWHDAIHDYSPLNYDSLGNPGVNICGLESPVPCDDHKHGTHTMGTMTGDDKMGNQIGVAPAAKWVGCRNMERGWGRPSSYIECFQWFLAPTDVGGMNPDPSKAPHVINNSWYCSIEEGCVDTTVNELLHSAVKNLRSSGVIVVVSVGNDGVNGCSSANFAPAYFEESFSVGATRMNDTITGFSTRGPVTIDQSNRTKPNISAPGQDVRSCVLNGEYQNLSGTSMAGPHVVGVVALILSARPDLAGEVDVIEDILEQTAVPSFDTIPCGNVAGDAIPNNTYGYGRVDALAALQVALAYSPVSTPLLKPVSVQVMPNPVIEQAAFFMENLSGKSQLSLFDSRGAKVFTKSWTGNNTEVLRIPLASHAAGVYYWQLLSESGVASGKLLKL